MQQTKYSSWKFTDQSNTAQRHNGIMPNGPSVIYEQLPKIQWAVWTNYGFCSLVLYEIVPRFLLIALEFG